MTCPAQPQLVSTPEIWNPLPDFVTVHQDNQVGNIVDGNQLYADIFANHQPAVSWVIPSGDDSEHPPGTIVAGQDHVRVPGLVISPYAKEGYIDHQVPSFDAYLKFIEDDFLGGQRLGGLGMSPGPLAQLRVR